MTRRYTDDEVREIFGRAAEDEPARLPPSAEGLSLEQIKEIGAEVGIDGASLERAARSLPADQPQTRSPLTGGALSLHAGSRISGDLGAVPMSEIPRHHPPGHGDTRRDLAGRRSHRVAVER